MRLATVDAIFTSNRVLPIMDSLMFWRSGQPYEVRGRLTNSMASSRCRATLPPVLDLIWVTYACERLVDYESIHSIYICGRSEDIC